MNRSFLTIAVTLPLSVAFTSFNGVNAAEVQTISQPDSPALSAHSKPVSTITFTQRENNAATGKFVRPLLIAAPTISSATPAPQTTTPVQKVAAPVAIPIVVKATVPTIDAPKVALTPSVKTPTLTAQGKANVNLIKSTGPSLETRKEVAPSKSLVTLNVSKPEVQPVTKASTEIEKSEKSVTKVLANAELFPKETPKAASPARLASREARAQQLLLARLDADLAQAERRLQRSETRLSEGQRQLGSINNIIKSAMMGLGSEGKGLHPFVRVAQRYLGTPYVWGGESARGFDCSGFIMRVMRDLGYRALPHSAAEQFRYGTPIAKPLLRAGDIVFFANTYKPGVSHVGIYLGRGRFIHAANSQVGTIVSGLNEPKWVAHYAGARRLVSQ